MDNKVIWIIVAVIAAIVLLGLLVMMMRRGSAESHRAEAAQLRDDAADTERALREREAHAAEVDAHARRARAEADQRAAEAEKLELERDRRGEAVDSLRARHDEQLREADRIDPDVRTDRDGTRLDGDRDLEARGDRGFDGRDERDFDRREDDGFGRRDERGFDGRDERDFDRREDDGFGRRDVRPAEGVREVGQQERGFDGRTDQDIDRRDHGFDRRDERDVSRRDEVWHEGVQGDDLRRHDDDRQVRPAEGVREVTSDADRHDLRRDDLGHQGERGFVDRDRGLDGRDDRQLGGRDERDLGGRDERGLDRRDDGVVRPAEGVREVGRDEERHNLPQYGDDRDVQARQGSRIEREDGRVLARDDFGRTEDLRRDGGARSAGMSGHDREATGSAYQDLGHENRGFDRDAYAQDGSRLRGADDEYATSDTDGRRMAEPSVTPEPVQQPVTERRSWRDRLRRR